MCINQLSVRFEATVSGIEIRWVLGPIALKILVKAHKMLDQGPLDQMTLENVGSFQYPMSTMYLKHQIWP